MSLPQFFGNWGSDLPATFAYYRARAAAVKIPVMVQDHPVSGVAMNADFLSRLASEIEGVSYFKLECTQSPFKMARVLAQAGKRVKALFGGESGIYFIEEYERGGRGALPAYWDAETWRQCMDYVQRLDPATFGVPVKHRVSAKPGRKERALGRAAGR